MTTCGAHDLIGTCVCGPRLEEQDDGRVLVIHHSIDGRELTEPQGDSL